MKLSFDIVSENEIGAIVSIRNEASAHLTSLYGKGHWSYQVSENGVKHDMKGNSKVFIAKQDTDAVGTLRLTSKKPWAIDVSYFTPVTRAVYLVDMAIRPPRQGKGIGRYMLERVISFALEWPAQSIRLDAYDHAAGAEDFYRKCGYTDKGHVVYKNNPLIYFELLI